MSESVFFKERAVQSKMSPNVNVVGEYKEALPTVWYPPTRR